MSLRINHLNAVGGEHFATLHAHEPVHFARISGPGIEHHALSAQALVIGQSVAPFDPLFGVIPGGERPPHEALDLIFGVDHQPVVAAINLAYENTRPSSKPHARERRFSHEVTDRETQCDYRLVDLYQP